MQLKFPAKIINPNWTDANFIITVRRVSRETGLNLSDLRLHAVFVTFLK